MKGRKRHIMVDTLGLLHELVVTGINMGDRGGVRLLLARSEKRLPRRVKIFVDLGYTGPELAEFAKLFGNRLLEVVPRRPGSSTFEVLPRRWIVERTFAWITRCRRLAKDVEASTSSSEAMVRLAMIRLMFRRLAPL